MNALTAGWSRRVVSRNRPRSSATVTASPTRCSSDEAAEPPGCTPCVTIGSWFGSPMRTIELAHAPTATVFASDIWLASSTNRTSKAPSNSGRANSHGGRRDHVRRTGAAERRRPPRSSRGGSRPSRWPTCSSSSPAFCTMRTVTGPWPDVGRRRPRDDRLDQIADRLVRLGRDRRPASGGGPGQGSSGLRRRSCPCPADPGSAARRARARAPDAWRRRGSLPQVGRVADPCPRLASEVAEGVRRARPCTDPDRRCRPR